MKRANLELPGKIRHGLVLHKPLSSCLVGKPGAARLVNVIR